VQTGGGCCVRPQRTHQCCPCLIKCQNQTHSALARIQAPHAGPLAATKGSMQMQKRCRCAMQVARGPCTRHKHQLALSRETRHLNPITPRGCFEHKNAHLPSFDVPDQPLPLPVIQEQWQKVRKAKSNCKSNISAPSLTPAALGIAGTTPTDCNNPALQHAPASSETQMCVLCTA
jgi:hypothetical protein